MAAMLIEIKSRMLLPPRKSADGKEAEDPRAELVRRLIEYEQMKLAAARLDALPLLGRDFLRAQVAIERVAGGRGCPTVAPPTCATPGRHPDARASLHQHHLISREQLSVREHMSIVAARACRAAASPMFEELFDAARGRAGVVVTFIALLELAREHLLEVTQAEAFAPIYVRLAYQAREPAAPPPRPRVQLPGAAVRRGRATPAGRPQRSHFETASPAIDLDRHRRRLEHACA